MEVIRLSDKVPHLLEICASCRLSIQIPSLKTKDNPDISCQLCTIIHSLQSKKPNVVLLPKILARLFPPPSPRKQLKKALSGETLDSLNNLIFYAIHLNRTEANFEHPYIPPGELSKSPPPPIVRLVPQRKIDISLVKKWIAGCEKAHSKCHPLPDINFESHNQLQILLVDVRNKTLVETLTACRYMALSYVRGRVPQLLLRQSNVVELRKHMSLQKRWGEIPRLVQDAILFVEDIGEQYLWIDTLCIVQDGESRHDQIARMDEIYKSASCTLIALDSKEASDSLPGVRPNTRKAPQMAKLSGVDISRRRPELAGILLDSSYETRGWTFQERLLSNRCLYFTNEQVYFHCQTVLWSEDKYEYFQQDAESFRDLSLPWRPDAQYQKSLDKHEVYARLVDQYTQRVLSFQSDRLTAFTGITNSLGREWNWRFLHGIPLQTLHYSLLWAFTSLPQKLICKDKNETAEITVQIPSWSWSGWTGGVHHQLAATHIPGFTLPSNPQQDDNITIIFHNKDARVRILKEGRVERIPRDAEWDTIVKTRTGRPSRDLLCFTAEKISTKGFIFYQSRVSRDSSLWKENNLVTRITDSQYRACGILFHERTDLFSNSSLSSSTPSNSSSNANLQFILLGTTRRPLVYKLEGIFFKNSRNDDLMNGYDKDNEDDEPNVYHDDYVRSERGWGTCNVMLVEWRGDGEFAERVAVGQICEGAWEEAGARLGRVILG